MLFKLVIFAALVCLSTARPKAYSSSCSPNPCCCGSSTTATSCNSPCEQQSKWPSWPSWGSSASLPQPLTSTYSQPLTSMYSQQPLTYPQTYAPQTYAPSYQSWPSSLPASTSYNLPSTFSQPALPASIYPQISQPSISPYSLPSTFAQQPATYSLPSTFSQSSTLPQNLPATYNFPSTFEQHSTFPASTYSLPSTFGQSSTLPAFGQPDTLSASPYTLPGQTYPFHNTFGTSPVSVAGQNNPMPTYASGFSWPSSGVQVGSNGQIQTLPSTLEQSLVPSSLGQSWPNTPAGITAFPKSNNNLFAAIPSTTGTGSSGANAIGNIGAVQPGTTGHRGG